MGRAVRVILQERVVHRVLLVLTQALDLARSGFPEEFVRLEAPHWEWGAVSSREQRGSAPVASLA